MQLAPPQEMPLVGGTLRAPSLHLMIPSLRVLSFALSTKHFCSSASVNPSPKPFPSKSLNPAPPFARPKHKALPNSAVSSQRQSIEHIPSNATKPRPDQTEPPNKHPVSPELEAETEPSPKEYSESPADLLQRKLNNCLKRGHIVRALELYDYAVRSRTPLSVRHYNCLLYLCSLPSSSSTMNDTKSELNDPEIRKMAVEMGLKIYRRMCDDADVEPNEATFASLDRLKTLRLSIKHLASNPTKHQPNQTKPPSKHPKSSMSSADALAQREPFVSTKKKRKEFRESPPGLLQRDLDQCSKRGDTVRALELYDSAVAAKTRLSVRHYNCLLYLCSLPSSSSSIADVASTYTQRNPFRLPSTLHCNGEGDGDSDVSSNDAEAKSNVPEISKMALERGFEIYGRMCEDPDVKPNEATFTTLARLAAIKADPHMAFDLVKKMAKGRMAVKLRSYVPALHGFCDALDVEMAHEVETHMDASGVVPEEVDAAALLRAYATKGRADHVYRLLHRIRTLIRQVSEPTAEIIQSWFQSDAAAAVGAPKWDIHKIKQGVVQGGGGWHGQGWLGTGPWRVERSVMSKDGVCERCGEKLVSIDINPSETEGFARSLMQMRYFKDNRDQFTRFEGWLRRYGPFDAVIDAANVGLCNQKQFQFSQVNSVITRIRQLSPSKKMPLVILHARRVYDETANDPRNRKFIEDWKRAGCLYYTPPGSNDDWYWLYAAVRDKCFLVTNDEMRDHLFELLGTSFFPRWKEKHQVRLTFSSRGPTLHMPPPYSNVIQESENGSWHVPTTTGDDLEMPRQWICATRDTTNVVAGTSTTATSNIDDMDEPTQPAQRIS